MHATADARQSNAVALANALALMMCVPWTLCFAAYTLLHWTLPADQQAELRRRREEASKEDVAASSSPATLEDAWATRRSRVDPRAEDGTAAFCSGGAAAASDAHAHL